MAIQPPTTFEFDDNTHIQRLSGTLHAPHATAGDVPTAQADGSLLMQPGDGSQPTYTLADTAASAFKMTDELDTAGVNALSAYIEYLGDTVGGGGPDLYVVCLTRKTGQPYGFAPGGFGASVDTILEIVSAGLNDGTDGAYATPAGFFGVGQLSRVVAIPVNSAGSPTNAATGAMNFTDPNADLTFTGPALFDLGNQFSFELVDPGADNQPLALSSTTGFDFVISLGTDNTGAVTTIGNDLNALLTPYGITVAQATFGTPLAAHAPVTLSGGDNGTPGAGISYSISNA